MMLRREMYEIWSPYGATWVGWIKPVVFMNINESTSLNNKINFSIPKINFPFDLQENTALIIDLPNYEAILQGLAFAKIGYRPIPVFNGTDPDSSAMPIVDNTAKDLALIWGALQLKETDLSTTSPPAFLLDSSRTHRFRINSGIFDNSWDVYDQDLPSADYFLKQKITTIVVNSEKIQVDLTRILYKYQKKKLKIYFTKGFSRPKRSHIFKKK